ncbi:MAG: lamin tail domain-containing protein [Fibrobacterales bacterium]
MKYLLITLLLLCIGCDGTGSAAAPNSNQTALALKVSDTSIAVDSLKLVIIKGGTVLLNEVTPWNSDEPMVHFKDIPWGEDLHIECSLLDAQGVVRYTGTVIVSIEQGEIHEVDIYFSPQFAQVHIDVPVGLRNELEITSGHLNLMGVAQYDATLEGIAPNRFLHIDAVDFGEYAVVISLCNSEGDTLYGYESILTIDAETTPNLSITMQSLITHLKASVLLEKPTLYSGGLLFPQSTLRGVTERQDIIITELSPNPKTSGNEYEWIELFNTGIDTLDLAGCGLKKSINSESATTYLPLEEHLLVPPSGFVVLGRDSVSFADYHYSSFTLSNTAQSLILACESGVIDSLFYKSASDSLNPFPLDEGHSLEYGLKDIAHRGEGTAWCSGAAPLTFTTGLENFGSPHAFGECNE